MKLSLGNAAQGSSNYKTINFIKPGIINAVITEFRDSTNDETKANFNKPYISVSFLDPATGAILTDRWSVDSNLGPNRKQTDLAITLSKVRHLLTIMLPDMDIPGEIDIKEISKLVVGQADFEFKFSGKESFKNGKTLVFAKINFPEFVQKRGANKLVFNKENSFDYQPLSLIPGEKKSTVVADNMPF